MPKTKKSVLILTAPEGHASIAAAVKETLEAQTYQVHTLSKKNFLSTYKPFYLFFPSLFKIPFKYSQNRHAKKAIEKISTLQLQDSVYSAIDRYQPSLIIVTWFLYLPIIDAMKKVSSIPVINIVPDPRSFHPFELSRQSEYNLVFDQHAVKQAQQFHAPPKSLIPVGWFVRSHFTPASNLARLRSQLKLKPNLLTFLLTGGSQGTNLVTKIAPAFLQSAKPIQVVVNVGSNQLLAKLINSLKALSQYYPRSQAQLVTLPFTPNLHLYMQAADLVIGKAGPNTLFESVATHTPFFAITHIAGQEDGNLDIIKDYGLGYVQENPLHAIKLIRRIINRPQDLQAFTPNLKKMASTNRSSHSHLIKLAAQLTQKS